MTQFVYHVHFAKYAKYTKMKSNCILYHLYRLLSLLHIGELIKMRIERRKKIFYLVFVGIVCLLEAAQTMDRYHKMDVGVDVYGSVLFMVQYCLWFSTVYGSVVLFIHCFQR